MTRVGVVATVVLLLSVGNAGAARVQPQEESGSIMLPSPSPNAGEGCWPGTPRRAYIISQGQTAGPAGSVIEIDPSTWGGKFTLKATGSTGSEDVDMHFFVDIGKVDPTDPTMMNVVSSSTYQDKEPGGEAGLVPPQAKHVVLCLVPGTGAEVEWTYKALPPAKKKKG